MSDVEEIYRDGRIYDVMYAELTADRDFFVAKAVSLGGPVLEIACGTGRIAIPIARAGVDIEGVDISPAMLAEARRKSEGLTLPLHLADCREFSLARQFGFVFIAFNSMLHLHDRESLERFLACVRAHLRPGGTFMIDIFNPSVALLARRPRMLYHTHSFYDEERGERVVIEEEVRYDSATQVNHVIWHFDIGDGRLRKTEELNMRCYFPAEIEALLYYNGFDLVERFGGYAGEQFVSGSGKQILVCRAR